MAKTLFVVKLPATGKTYDLWVPNSLQMQTVSKLVSEAIQVEEPDYYSASPDAALMYVPTGEIQDPNATVSEIGFSDGSRFVLL